VLESLTCVYKAEWHEQILKQTERSDDCRLSYASCVHRYLMVCNLLSMYEYRHRLASGFNEKAHPMCFGLVMDPFKTMNRKEEEMSAQERMRHSIVWR
jgi:hypothetical protein